MGAVHGVYLKYVGLSLVSYGGYSYLTTAADAGAIVGSSEAGAEVSSSLLSFAGRSIFAYSCFVNGTIAVLFKLRRGMSLIGKNRIRGTIPMWSYIIWAPFHLPTIAYTYLHALKDSNKKTNGKSKVPVASEVLPGWWVGGRYGHLLDKDWAGTIDLTVEFPEMCINRTEKYMLVASWDGVPPSPELLEEAATFAAEARKRGDVMIHCAHGRGRSTTVMCAALVKAGEVSTWEEAIKVIQKGRPVCKLNGMMRMALTEWQTTYVDGKKGV